jgi:hypothetical protein
MPLLITVQKYLCLAILRLILQHIEQRLGIAVGYALARLVMLGSQMTYHVGELGSELLAGLAWKQCHQRLP